MMEKRFKSLLVLGLIIYIASSGYQIMIPLFPPLVNKKGIDKLFIGYIFCLYPVGGLIVSLFLGTNMTIGSMKKTMLLGVFMTFIGLLGFGLVKYIENHIVFIILASLARLVMGIGGTLCLTPAYAYIPFLYPEKLKQIMPNMQVCKGLGNFSGPAIGSLFYLIGETTPMGGYSTPFYMLGFIDLMIFPLILLFLKTDRRNVVKEKQQVSYHSGSEIIDEQITFGNEEKKNNQEQPKSKKDQQSVLSSHIEKLSYSKVFKIVGVVIIYITYFFLFTGTIGIRAYVGVYLQDEYLLSESTIGLYFIVRPIAFVLAAFTIGRFKGINIQYSFGLGLCLCTIASFLYGPDTELTGIPHQLWVCTLSDALNGVGFAFSISFITSIFIGFIRQKFPENIQDANDMASALYISAWSLGEFAGPLIGGQMVHSFGFPRASSISGFSVLLSTMAYFGYLYHLNSNKIKKINLLDQQTQ